MIKISIKNNQIKKFNDITMGHFYTTQLMFLFIKMIYKVFGKVYFIR